MASMSWRRLVVTYAVLAGWSCVCLFPFYWTLAASLKGPLEIVAGPFYAPFIDYTPSLDAWTYILFESHGALLLRYFNSAIVALTSTALTMLLAALAVYGLTRFRHAVPWLVSALLLAAAGFAGIACFAGAAGIRLPSAVAGMLALFAAIRVRHYGGPCLHGAGILIAILSTRILPPVVIVLPIYLMAQHAGLLDTRLALILTYTATNLPVAVWLLQPALGVATDPEEAAQLDGASHYRIFFGVVLPVAMRGVAAVALLIFFLCWSEYLFAVYLAVDHAMTMPPFLAAQMSVREQQAGSDAEEWARLSAAIVLMVAPLLLGARLAHRLIGGRTTLRSRR